jgi:transposase
MYKRVDVTPARRRRMAKDYARGKTLRELAEEVGVAYSTVRNWMVADQVELRKPGFRKAPRGKGRS